MRILLFGTILFFNILTAGAQEKFIIDSNHSTIAFTISIAGGLTDVSGSFTDYSGFINYFPNDVSQSEFEVTIKAESINTGHSGRDQHLRSADFFEVETYPEIQFKSSGVSEDDDGYVLKGTLLMHGISRHIEIPFICKHKEPMVWIFGLPTIVFEGSTKLNRKDFDIKANTRWNRLITSTGELAMSDEVNIHLKIIGEGKSVAERVVAIYTESGIEAAIDKYHLLKNEIKAPGAFDVNTLNRAGIRLYKNDVEGAKRLFNLNTQEYPESAVPLFTLGEVYFEQGDLNKSRNYLKQGLNLDPDNQSMIDLLNKVESK